MDLRTFLSEPRPPYRILSVFFGTSLLIAALGFGISEHFANWPGISFLGAIGVVFCVAGFVFSEATLQRVFIAAVWLNVAAALLALLLGVLSS